MDPRKAYRIRRNAQRAETSRHLTELFTEKQKNTFYFIILATFSRNLIHHEIEYNTMFCTAKRLSAIVIMNLFTDLTIQKIGKNTF